MIDCLKVAQSAYDERGAQQIPVEAASVLQFLAPRQPQRIVEVGVHDAGALWMWGQVTPAKGTSQVFGVDITGENVKAPNVEDLAPRHVDVFVGDSVATQTVEQAQNALTGPIDFLFIDGAHSREAVLADFHAWRPLVAPDGVIGFHDIAVAAREGYEDVLATADDVLVIEFRKRDSNVMRCGIGLVVLG